jgi:DNA-binding NtrC family response regulator
MVTTKGKILVVDDDPVLLRMLTDTLTAIGYAAIAARDGIEALHLLQESEGRFEVMITDVKMPNMDGISLLKRVRRYFPDLPVVFITGVASDKMITEASPDGYLAKPFRISRLEQLIDRTLESRRNGTAMLQALRVLVNVPQDDFRETLTEALSYSHYLPFAVSGGDEALEELKRGHFDLMITSLEKAGGDHKTIEYIRREHPDLPVVAVSSSYSPADLNHMTDEGQVDGFARQPFTIGELLDVLDRALAPRRDSVL